MKKSIGRIFIFVLIIIFLGNSFITFSYLVDEEAIVKNLKQTQNEMRNENTYQKVNDLSTSTLDNFTDSLMILTAAYDGEEKILEKAMANYRKNVRGTDPYQTLTKLTDESKLEQISYARYWHGYLIFLKPLLALMSYSKIRMVNAFLQGALLIAVLFLLHKRKLGYLILPFLSAYILIEPLTIMHSLQYSTVWYLVLGSMLVYLLFQEKIIEKKLHVFLFTGIGMLTSFFDLLTYPIATLGMLLILVITAENLNRKEALKHILLYGCFWTFGYSIMWISKWILATWILKENVFASANEAILSRSSDVLISGMKFSRMETFKRVFSYMNHWLTKWIIRINILVMIWKLAYPRIKLKINEIKVSEKNSNKIKKKNRVVKEMNSFWKIMLNQIPLLLLAMIPFVWYFVMANHSYVHSFFSFRTAVVFWFAIFSIASKIVKEWNMIKFEK